MLRVGFVVNPVAGMGGAVGLKGTDGEVVLREAIRRGARAQSPEKAEAALGSVPHLETDILFLTCKGQMGEDAFAALGIPCDIVCGQGEATSAQDTRAAVRAFMSREVDIIAFVGGDGTARDVLSETGTKVPIVGVPSGVKMHSAVFVNTPGEFGGLLSAFLRSNIVKEAEVLDIDEESFRGGTIRAKLFGVAHTPDSAEHIQAAKQSYASGSAAEEVDEMAQYIVESMEPGVTYVIGPGSTTAGIAKVMGQPKTLLGVDVYRDRVRVRADASESELLEELGSGRGARIVVSPIGAQGFFFGRGNQQISPSVIRMIGKENVVLVSTPAKLNATATLRVDTGDTALDEAFRGRLKVVTGYRRRRLVSVA